MRDRVPNLRHHMALLCGVHHRPDVHALARAVALHQLRSPLAEAGDEVLGDVAVHVDALRRHAHLSRVAERVARGERCRAVEIRTRQHNQRILASELEHKPLEPTRGAAHDVLARRAAADECDQVDVRLHQRAPLDAVAEDHLQRIGRKHGAYARSPRLRAQRALLARLEHHRVAREQRRQHDLLRHQHGEVPRRDARGDPERIEAQLAAHAAVVEHLRLQRIDDRIDLLRERVGRPRRLADCLAQRLAHLLRRQRADLRRGFLERRCRGGEDACPLRERDPGPRRLRAPGPLHRQTHPLRT